MSRDTGIRMGVTLTQRDLNILSVLADVYILTTDQICTMYFPSIESCRKRLNILKREGWLREELPFHFYRNSRKIIKIGKKACTEYGYSNCRAHASSFVDHQLGLNNIYVQLHKIGILEKLKFIWQDGSKFILEFDKKYLRPDARILGPNSQNELYLEYDRGTKNLLTIGDNLSNYLGYYDHKDLMSKRDDRGCIRVIYVTPKLSRARAIEEQFRKLCFKQSRSFGSKNYSFVFEVYPEDEFLENCSNILQTSKTLEPLNPPKLIEIRKEELIPTRLVLNQPRPELGPLNTNKIPPNIRIAMENFSKKEGL